MLLLPFPGQDKESLRFHNAGEIKEILVILGSARALELARDDSDRLADAVDEGIASHCIGIVCLWPERLNRP
jgi:hypothetical protein